jgi:hypothetical protein
MLLPTAITATTVSTISSIVPNAAQDYITQTSNPRPLSRASEAVTIDELRTLPDFLLDYFAAKERLASALSTVGANLRVRPQPADDRVAREPVPPIADRSTPAVRVPGLLLPADIRTELFESSKPLREKMLERLIPIALEELGIDGEKLRELARDTKKKRAFYFATLFPKIIKDAKSVGLHFDEKLIWRKADEFVSDSAE